MMKKVELTNYLKNRKIYIISPHLDDAILSTGMLLYSLKSHGNSTVINIFTKAHGGPYTLSAHEFIKVSGCTNASELFEKRKKEDTKALKSVKTKNIDLKLQDALFRRKKNHTYFGKYIPELDHIYPTYRWHVLKKIQPGDTALEELKIKLTKTIPSDAIVFSPLGIGNHSDHAITHQVCSKLFKNIFYYMDFPYNVRLNYHGNPPAGYKKFELEIDLAVKSKLIRYYSSQIYGLFPGGIVPKHKENFFLPKKIKC